MASIRRASATGGKWLIGVVAAVVLGAFMVAILGLSIVALAPALVLLALVGAGYIGWRRREVRHARETPADRQGYAELIGGDAHRQSEAHSTGAHV